MPTPADDARVEPLGDPELCGRMVAWLAATLAGSVDPGTALSAIQYDSDGQVAVGWSEGNAEVDFADVFTGLLSTGVRSVALALPVAGDPLGLTSSGAFAQAALDAEAAVVIGTDSRQLGLIPTRDLRGSSYRGWRWQVFVEPAVALTSDAVTPFAPVGTLPPADPLHVVEQTDRALNRALRDATADLAALDLAQWRPEVAAGRKEAEAALRTAGQRMPPGWPAPARALAERSLVLWRIVRVARADAGASSASGSHARGVALSRLSHAVRTAAMVAYNVPVVTLPIARPDVIIDLVQRPLA
ncbi:MAG TPA: hypothetical protein VIL94_03480 [Acidothermaceae bacterium]